MFTLIKFHILIYREKLINKYDMFGKDFNQLLLTIANKKVAFLHFKQLILNIIHII